MLPTARCKPKYHARKEIEDSGGFGTSRQRYISRKEQIEFKALHQIASFVGGTLALRQLKRRVQELLNRVKQMLGVKKGRVRSRGGR